jgi:hypothetical protein
VTKRVEELVEGVCGGGDHPLAPYLRLWCLESRQFLAFAEVHATKIRKKARFVAAGHELADLLAELAVAAHLARDRRYSLIYESHLSTGSRGPDFQVTQPNGSTFHVEVTRLRPTGDGDLAGTAARLARVLGDKSGQLPAGTPNVLAVVIPPGRNHEALVPAAIRLLDTAQTLPEEQTRGFQRTRQRLSAVALCSFSAEWSEPSVRLWTNPQARHPLKPEVAKYLAPASPG